MWGCNCGGYTSISCLCHWSFIEGTRGIRHPSSVSPRQGPDSVSIDGSAADSRGHSVGPGDSLGSYPVAGVAFFFYERKLGLFLPDSPAWLYNLPPRRDVADQAPRAWWVGFGELLNPRLPVSIISRGLKVPWAMIVQLLGCCLDSGLEGGHQLLLVVTPLFE